MKHYFFILLFLFLLWPVARPGAQQEDRRIEEEKRKALQPTEAQYYLDPPVVLDTENQTRAYFQQLMRQDVANASDGAYVLLVLLKKADEMDGFERQKQFLIDNRFLSPKASRFFTKEAPLSRGVFARMLINALDIKGGLTLRVFGPSERYAHRELVYENIMVSGDPGEYMSGRELVYSFIQAVDYIDRHKSSQ
jgi:hypothetical protein